MENTKRQSVEFETQTHRNEGRFTIPKQVRNQLGLSSHGGAIVHLIIRTAAGGLLFEGDKMKKSGSEIYGKDIREKGIKARQRLVVTVSLLVVNRPSLVS